MFSKKEQKRKKGNDILAATSQPFDYSQISLNSEEEILNVKRQLERDKYVLEQQKAEFAGEQEIARLQEQIEKLEAERKEMIAANKKRWKHSAIFYVILVVIAVMIVVVSYYCIF